MTYQPLTAPDVGFDAEGHFRNLSYGDVYHSKDGAVGQAEHVFIQGNNLPQRWRGRRHFTVCETGFGVGLNFLTLWQAWREDSARSDRLHMLSIEAHPFDREGLQQALLRVIPESWRARADQLVSQWPTCLPGLHRLEFEGGAVTLTLAFGKATTVAARLSASVDAYFFDGFAPKLNPEAWEPALLRQLSSLAAADATCATWASNGVVRQALVSAGFSVKRRPGYAGKWHMTTGVRMPSAYPSTRAPKMPKKNAFCHKAWQLAREADRAGKGEVIVIGAGLAGAGIAHSLALRGRSVVVIDMAALDSGGSHAGHVAAAMTPVVARDDNALARLSRAGSGRALARWMSLPMPAAPVRCGTLQLERDSGRMASLVDTVEQLKFPETWVRCVDRDEASRLAGMPVERGGVFFGDGLFVQPAVLIPALLKTPGIRLIQGQAAALQRISDTWQINGPDGKVLAQASTVIVANAFGAHALLNQSGLLEGLPKLAHMYRIAGQMCQIPDGQLAGGPRCIVGGEGYLLPSMAGYCVAGSTYDIGAESSEVNATGQRVVLDKVVGLVGCEPLLQSNQGNLSGWAGWRAVLPGRLPAIGPLPQAPGIWVATGFASRGLTWSALSGDVIAAALCEEPLPLEVDLLAAIAPR